MEGEGKVARLWGPSRVQNKCHWCGNTSKERLKQCGKCKEVVYCSRECQKVSWPYHKGECQHNSEFKKRANTLGSNEEIIQTDQFQRWHYQQVNAIHHAVICALDLAKHPENADKMVVYLKFSPREYTALERSKLSPLSSKLYELKSGCTITIPEAMVFTSRIGVAKTVFDDVRRIHEESKCFGSLGMVLAIMDCDPKICSINQILLPPQPLAQIDIMRLDWRSNWVGRLRHALENEVAIPDPHFGLGF